MIYTVELEPSLRFALIVVLWNSAATFNIYGAAAKDPKKTFGDTDKQERHNIISVNQRLTTSLDSSDGESP